MKRRIYRTAGWLLAGCALFSASAGFSAHAQTMEDVLAQIENNNPSLQVAASEAELVKIESRDEAVWADPEVEFNWLWGQNSEVGNRHDLKITQSFDIAGLSGMRSRQAEALGNQGVLKYKAERLNVLLEAKLLCIELIFDNALKAELSTHLDHAEILVGATGRKVELGEASVLELNKVKLHMASVQDHIARIDVDRARILTELRRMNGGEAVDLTQTVYPSSYQLPRDFETWYSEAAEQNPVLQYIAAEVELGKSQLKIDKTQWVPNLTLGYMSEIGASDKYRGLTVGVAIPLWRNSNKIRKTNAQVTLARDRQKQAELEFYYRLREDYNSAASLKDIADSYHEILMRSDTRTYLLEAQTKGEISMIDYIIESDLYYDSIQEWLEAERDYQTALANLCAVLL